MVQGMAIPPVKNCSFFAISAFICRVAGAANECAPPLQPLISSRKPFFWQQNTTKGGKGIEQMRQMSHKGGRGRFQMAVIGERQVTGGNGRRFSGHNVWIWSEYGKFLAR
jgi:hypothetical protein